MQENRACEGLFALQVFPHTEHSCELYAARTLTMSLSRSISLYAVKSRNWPRFKPKIALFRPDLAAALLRSHLPVSGHCLGFARRVRLLRLISSNAATTGADSAMALLMWCEVSRRILARFSDSLVSFFAALSSPLVR